MNKTCPLSAFRKALKITERQSNDFGWDVDRADNLLYSLKNKVNKSSFKEKNEIERWVSNQKFERVKDESVFALDPRLAFYYARYVLKSRFSEELEGQMFHSSNDEDPFWLLKYFKYFFREEERLPEKLHNRMILATFSEEQNAVDYIRISKEKTEERQDKENFVLIFEVMQKILQDNEKIKNIPADQVSRVLKKILVKHS